MTLPFIDLPIVLAPLGGAATVALAAAVSNARGFAILPCAYAAPDDIERDIAALRAATTRPFGVNLFIEAQPYVADDAAIARAHRRLAAYRAELGLAQPAAAQRPPERYAAQIEAVLRARPAVFTFTFGLPDAVTLQRFRAAGIFTLGTATTVAEARALAAAGVDGIVAQGAEAGAHRGTFLAPVEASLIGTLALVPQVVDATRLPVIAAGGIGDGRGVAAVLALGAQAAALGTSFLLARESGIAPAYRAALRGPAVHDTVVTRAFSGRAARGIRNRATSDFAGDGDVAPYPFQNAMTRDIRVAAAAQGRGEFLSLWAGQAAALAREDAAAAIVATLASEAATCGRVLAEMTARFA
ncbi:MAG: nitronate monooxygenase [Vulcanimicrobiaceae bacterium]